MQESCGGSTKSTKIEMLKTVKGMKTGRVIPLLSQWGRWEHCHLSLAGPDGPQPPTAFWCILALKLQLFAPENRQQRYYIKRTDRQKMNIYISNQNCRIAAKNWEVIHQSTKKWKGMHACMQHGKPWLDVMHVTMQPIHCLWMLSSTLPRSRHRKWTVHQPTCRRMLSTLCCYTTMHITKSYSILSVIKRWRDGSGENRNS